MAIFNKEDFSVCSVPVPPRYPQSQTHTSVREFNGYLYMMTSPFPNPKYNKIKAYFGEIIRRLTFGFLGNTLPGEYFENPCFYSCELNKNKSAVCFKPYLMNPLVDTPCSKYGLPSYNSDPELLIIDSHAYILNRTIYRKPIQEDANNYKLVSEISLINACIEKGSIYNIEKKSFLTTEDCFISPSLFYLNNKYGLCFLDTNSYNDGHTFNAMYIVLGDTIESLSDLNNKRIVKVNTKRCLPWHFSIFEYNGKLYSIIAGTICGRDHYCQQFLGEFNDGLTSMQIFEEPLVELNSYRGSAYVSEDGVFHLYSTTVYEDFKEGKSVDGREVIKTEMPFDKLLNILKTIK